MLIRCRDGLSEEERFFRRQGHLEQRNAPGKGICLESGNGRGWRNFLLGISRAVNKMRSHWQNVLSGVGEGRQKIRESFVTQRYDYTPFPYPSSLSSSFFFLASLLPCSFLHPLSPFSFLSSHTTLARLSPGGREHKGQGTMFIYKELSLIIKINIRTIVLYSQYKVRSMVYGAEWK